jgi:hypothetical protein
VAGAHLEFDVTHAAVVRGLDDFRERSANGVTIAALQHGLWIWLHSGGVDGLLDAARLAARTLAPAATLARNNWHSPNELNAVWGIAITSAVQSVPTTQARAMCMTSWDRSSCLIPELVLALTERMRRQLLSMMERHELPTWKVVCSFVFPRWKDKRDKNDRKRPNSD